MRTVFGFIERILSRNNAFFKVIAYVQNNQLIEVEDHYIDFPNNGKVFFYNITDNAYVGKLGFYTLSESSTFDDDLPTSSKYVVSTEQNNLGYFEIVEANYSFLNHQHEILTMLQNGMAKTHQFSSKIFLLTTDDFLIGPFSTKLNNKNQWIAEFNDSGLLEVRKNSVNFIKHFDINWGIERYFTSFATTNTPVEHYLDCSTNERIVRDALKILREEKKIQEVSRKVITLLGDLVNETPAEVRKNRISRAYELLQSYLVSDEDIDKLDSELLQYEPVVRKVNVKLAEELEKAKKKLEYEHKKIINETNQLTSRKEKLQTEIKKLEEDRKSSETGLKKANEALQQKIKDMQENVYQTFLNLLPSLNLPTEQPGTSSIVTHTQNSQWFVRENEKEIAIQDVGDLIGKITANLEQINVKEEDAKFIALIAIGAMLFRKPLIIKGENSFDIAQTLGWTVAGNDHITIFPDIKGYSNEVLVSCFQSYKRFDSLKSLHVSNIEASSAELYIPSFINYWGISTNPTYPDLLILSVKNMDELSESFLNQLKYAPIIDTGKMAIKGRVRSARLQGAISFGYTCAEAVIGNTELISKKSNAYKEFKNVLEEIIGMDAQKIKNEFNEWFCLLEASSYSEEEINKWVLSTFLYNYIDSEQFNNIAEELMVEQVLNF